MNFEGRREKREKKKNLVGDKTLRHRRNKPPHHEKDFVKIPTTR
jgi:hypothetical protein